MKKNDFNIDFVVTWVDGADKNWIDKRAKYDNSQDNLRFRDYGVFKYWFRAVEKYAPWVHKVYLITDNQQPSWIDSSNSKIVCLNHSDFISPEKLPVFNSNAIEMNIPYIEGLSEHFVVFNDDMFLNAKTKPSDFFWHDGRPRDSAIQNAIMPVEDFDHISVNNVSLINQNFSKYKVMKKNLSHFFNFRYSYYNVLNILLFPWKRFTRFYDPHIPVSLIKSDCKSIMTSFPKIIESTTNSRFRSKTDYSFWLYRYFQLVKGDFKPKSLHSGKKYNLSEIKKISKDILKSQHQMICINDVEMADMDFEIACSTLRKSFELTLPSPSSFEIIN